MSDTVAAEPAPIHSFGLQSADVIPIVIAISAVTSGLSGQEPTGNSIADFALTAAFGGALAWLARWAGSQSLLLSAVLALFFTGLQLPFALVGVVATASAFFVTSVRRLDHESRLIAGTVTGALVAQTVLNLPNIRWVGSASLLTLVAIAPILWTAWPRVPSQYRRRVYAGALAAATVAIASAILAAFAALSVRDSVEAGIAQAQDGVAALQSGDQERAIAFLTAAQQNFENASERLESPMTWPGRFVPVVAQHSRALETAAKQGSLLARTAVRTLNVADVEQIRGQNGVIDLDLVRSVDAELATANGVLREAQESLADVRTAWLVPPVDRRLAAVQTELAATNEDIDLANNATAVLPSILGADSPRRYLVLFVQPAEAREYGGFVGAYGILVADDGRISLLESGSIDSELGTGEALFTNPGDFPAGYRELLPELNPQNLTGIADLPTIALAAQDLVPQWREDDEFQIDGVMTIDPYGLAGLLELTGPIAIDSGAQEISSDNVVEFLLREQYFGAEADARAERQEALEELAGAGFQRLLQIELPGPERLGSIFGPLARANRVGFVTFDEAENRFLHRVFLLGEMPIVGELVEMIGVHQATAVASKLDAYANRSLVYEVTVNPATGQVTGAMEVVLTNEAPSDAGGYVLGAIRAQARIDGERLPLGDNLVAVSVYTRSVVEDLGSDQPFRPLDTTDALTYDRHAIVVEVPNGKETHVSFRTQSVVMPGRYDLLLLAQATANIGEATVIVRPTPGWRVVSDLTAADGSWTSTETMDVSRSFTFFFEQND